MHESQANPSATRAKPHALPALTTSLARRLPMARRICDLASAVRTRHERWWRWAVGRVVGDQCIVEVPHSVYDAQPVTMPDLDRADRHSGGRRSKAHTAQRRPGQPRCAHKRCPARDAPWLYSPDGRHRLARAACARVPRTADRPHRRRCVHRVDATAIALNTRRTTGLISASAPDTVKVCNVV
jgi:hypothetical protein